MDVPPDTVPVKDTADPLDTVSLEGLMETDSAGFTATVSPDEHEYAPKLSTTFTL